MIKLLSKIKVQKNHTFLLVYEHEYCDVKRLVLVGALNQEGALEGLKVELVEQLDVFGKP